MSFLKRLKGTTKEHFVIAHFDAYQDGVLAEKESAVYEGHLVSCQTCQAWAQRQENLVAQLGLEMAPPAVLTPAAAKRIQKDLYRSMRRAVIMNNIRTSAATVGALAVLALVVGVFVLWQAGGFGSRVQLPLLNQEPAAQGEVVLSDQDEELLKALANDNVDELTSLLEAGADPNAQSSPGRPALYLATLHGNAEVVRLLIDHGADIQAETVDGAILVKAAVEGHREIVEMLLDAGADVNSTGRDFTPDDPALYAAADHGYLDIAELLVERGADVNQLNQNGGTPLMTAASQGWPEIVTLLLENGADIDRQNSAAYTSQNSAADGLPIGMTALHWGVYRFNRGWGTPENKLEVVRILIEHGAALDIENDDGQTPLDLALPGSEMWQLLREAGATEGQGSVPGIKTTDQAALDEGLLKALANDDVDELASLLEAGADPNAQSSPGRPVLYLATLHGNAEVVQLLIDHGADVNAETVDGAILVKAAVEGQREIMEMLLDAGADVNATGRDWTPEDTALLAAANHGYQDIAELLVERGPDVNYLDSQGGTALMTAASRGRPEIVTLLLENGADSLIDYQIVEAYTVQDVKWTAGRTALHMAAYGGYGTPENKLEVVRILIEHGAALDIEDDDGQTPLDLAVPGSEIWQMLREAGAGE